jgi:EAL domain-containing protein (putative c-di-GMP-specific phosphodiesterase class I)
MTAGEGPPAFAHGTGTHRPLPEPRAQASQPATTLPPPAPDMPPLPTTRPVMHEYVAGLASLQATFEEMLGTLTLAFQPIVRSDNRQLYGYEALMRPNHPAFPHPGAALDAAERLHRLPQLGRTVRTLAAQRFAATGVDHGTLFVNLHALDLLDKSLASRWTPLAKIANRVVLEVTERASLDGVSDVAYRVAQLRDLGFRIAIDDLGAGHERMTRFDPKDTDFVKLDISMVRDIDRHMVKQQFAIAITQLCRDNGILVIGEGVETAAEAKVLSEIGCDLLQGYYLGRPGPDLVRPRTA